MVDVIEKERRGILTQSLSDSVAKKIEGLYHIISTRSPTESELTFWWGCVLI